MSHLRAFAGSMDMNSTGATVYAYWQYYFYSSLLREQTEFGPLGKDRQGKDEEGNREKLWTTKSKMTLFDSYAFNEFFRRMIYQINDAVVRGSEVDPYDALCKRGFDKSPH